jgi:Transposase IS66 family
MTAAGDPGTLSHAELLEIIAQLRAEVAALRAENAALKDEIRRLKGLPPRPPLKPSGMERSSTPKPAPTAPPKRRRGASRAIVTEDQHLRLEPPPTPAPGLRYLGQRCFVVQDLAIGVRVIRYRRDRWQLPDGRIAMAALPAGVDGHFGSELRRLVLLLYHQGQSTVERIVALLRDIGVSISKRQVVRILTGGIDAFVREANQVLGAGLATARWVSVDDTGARHRAVNSICTQIGNDRFAVFSTTPSKSRLNFLRLLHAGAGSAARWVLNTASRAYMLERGLPVSTTDNLHAAGSPREPCVFADETSWNAYLRAHGLEPKSGPPDPFHIASEGALWGGLIQAKTLEGTVILSDGAGQFVVGEHARCWVHMERQIHALDSFSDRQHRAKVRIQSRIWWLYKDIKAWCREPMPGRRRARQLARRFDRIVGTKTGFATLDRLLERIGADRASFLKILERPEIPLHTNGSENDIRSVVTRRKISGGTQSDHGRTARDTLLSLMKTCKKLEVSFWDYLGDRLGASAPKIPPLAALIASR